MDKNLEFNLTIIEGINHNLKEKLLVDYQIDELDIEDVFTSDQLSKIELKSNYLYIALQFPEYDKADRTFLIKEIHCFLNDNYFLLINKDNFKYVYLFDNFKDTLISNKSTTFNIFYEFLDFTITKLTKVIINFRREINEIEKSVTDFNDNKDLLIEILIVKKNLINFISIISPLKEVLDDLKNKYHRFIDDSGKEKIDDSLDKLVKILNNLKNFKEQITLFQVTNESQIARSTNNVIKTLTVANVLLFVPSLITGIFGMNVNFGFINSEEFSIFPWIVIFGLISLSITGLIIFLKYKKWF